MRVPDMIVLVIGFTETDKFHLQVDTKDFILGKPDRGKAGELERRVESELGRKTLSCYRFSLVRYPITIPGTDKAATRAVGAVGLFRFIGSADDAEATMKSIRKVCDVAAQEPKFEKWDRQSIEVYTAEKWLG